MRYKAIVLDLDGTTVIHGVENLPSTRVTAAIEQARKKIHVCVATARLLPEARPVFTHLSLSGPCVLNNGTQIYDPVGKKVLKEFLLHFDALTATVEVCRKYHIEVRVCDGERDLLYRPGMNLKKILSMYLPRVKPSMTDSVVKELMAIPYVDVHKSDSWSKGYMTVDVTRAGASKLHGIVEVAKILSIDTHEIIGVGDGYNDFALLMACGLKIAMGNAVPELKAIADFVAPSVDEDGVATVIEKFVLTG